MGYSPWGRKELEAPEDTNTLLLLSLQMQRSLSHREFRGSSKVTVFKMSLGFVLARYSKMCTCGNDYHEEVFTQSSLELGGTDHHTGPHGEVPGLVRRKT